MWEWITSLGLSADNVREYDVPQDDLAHYSKRTIDFEYNFPGKGFDELYGLAYRTDHDLKSHMEASGEKMVYTPAEGAPFVPHVIEPTFGVDRTVMAVLCEAYTEDEMDGETRVFLKLKPELAPVKVAVFPLLKNRPELVAKAREVFEELKHTVPQVLFDDNGNVGKRYRRQDEIGTPYCVTVDFDTLEDNTVTVRDRDTGEQKRIALTDLLTVVSG
jgi:glycyl-tRNA synthetase